MFSFFCETNQLSFFDYNTICVLDAMKPYTHACTHCCGVLFIRDVQ